MFLSLELGIVLETANCPGCHAMLISATSGTFLACTQYLAQDHIM